MPVNDIWQWACEVKESSGERGLYAGHVRLNVETNPDYKDTAIALLNKVEDLVNDVVEIVSNEDVVGVCATAKRVSPTGGRIIADYTPGIAGLLTSSSTLAAQLAIIVSKYSETQTRSGRGRAYLPFPAHEVQASGTIDDAIAVALDTPLAALFGPTSIVDAESNEWGSGIYSRKLSVFYPCVEAVLRPVLGTQRGRADHHQSFS